MGALKMGSFIAAEESLGDKKIALRSLMGMD